MQSNILLRNTHGSVVYQGKVVNLTEMYDDNSPKCSDSSPTVCCRGSLFSTVAITIFKGRPKHNHFNIQCGYLMSIFNFMEDTRCSNTKLQYEYVRTCKIAVKTSKLVQGHSFLNYRQRSNPTDNALDSTLLQEHMWD